MAEKKPGTEALIAPVEQPVAPVYTPPPAPRQMQIERQGQKSEPYTRRFPQIRGGTCEFCGTIDPMVHAEQQYKMCPHYRGMQAMCSYCPETKDPDQVIGHSVINVAEHPDNPNKLIMWCDSYECSKAHETRFKKNRNS